MSSYFTVPLFARAKKNQDELRKINPQNPVLKDEDEKYLEKQISSDEVKDRIIFDTRKNDSRPPSSSGGKKSTWDEGIDLPSQEEAEAITHNYHAQAASHEPRSSDNPDASTDKRTWASYLPSIPNPLIKSSTSPTSPSKPKSPSPSSTGPDPRTWTEYATSYIPRPLRPARTDADASPTPIYNADGTLNQDATRAQQENEIAVLLSNLDTSTLNNRVFALSAETQKLYSRFADVLRDTIAGVPTAYADMEALMREAGPTLETRFRALPPFVQALVRSLPAKIGTMVGPAELLATVAGKPKLEVAEEKGSEGKGKGKGRKKRRRIPGLKSLLSKEGAVAGMLRAAVEFVQVRFPFLASMTNLVMSLAVFILMFVCWYCHKRGKEVRLAKEADAEKAEGDDGSLQVEYTDSGSDEESEDGDPELEARIEEEIDEKLREPEKSENVSSDTTSPTSAGVSATNDKK